MMTDRTLPEPQATAYLDAKFDRLTRAVADKNTAEAMAVVREIRDDGFITVADDVLDGLIAAFTGQPAEPDSTT